MAANIFDPFKGLFRFPSVGITDVVEIAIIAFVLYKIMLWIQTTKAWNLLRGFAVILAIYLVTTVLQFTTIPWIINNTLNVGIIAIVILFQPEIRRALEQLGNKNIFSSIFAFGEGGQRKKHFDETVVNEIVRASVEMGKARTGALIVIERDNILTEYEKTGIAIDGIVTSELLLNIFEHNTPLHDGAVVLRGNRVVSATCYLPLSENMAISKELGTRHRAGLGISEVTDSLTVIVSEETGHISIAQDGALSRKLSGDQLKNELMKLITVNQEEKHQIRLLKGRHKA
ncbi:MAG: diadenylate cyclase CdaA [Lachnospiraceae bacterium]|nr:diadenylate cyclase CdaA [Lachnospiraceae bacterium]